MGRLELFACGPASYEPGKHFKDKILHAFARSDACYISPMLRWVQSLSSEERLCRRRKSRGISTA